MSVQLDNELDFYPCSDPKGYISALRDMAVQHGISVPLIACAGQGDCLRLQGSLKMWYQRVTFIQMTVIRSLMRKYSFIGRN